MIRRAACCLFLLCAGCASSQGWDRASVEGLLEEADRRFVGGVAPAQAAPPRATSPFRLGVYLRPADYLQRRFEWTDEDRETVASWGKRLRELGIVEDMVLLTNSSIKGNGLPELSAAAKRYGADALLVVDGAAAVDRYNNHKAALLYWTILGAYVADGTHSDALVLAHGSLWDVRDAHRLTEERAEGAAKQVGPAAFVDDAATITEAKRHALARLLERLADRLRPTRERVSGSVEGADDGGDRHVLSGGQADHAGRDFVALEESASRAG